MKKAIGIIILGLLLSGNAYSNEKIYLKCTGIFPDEITNQLIPGMKETQTAKIDFRKKKITFVTGYEFILDKDLDVRDHDFSTIHGSRKPLLTLADTEEIFLDRFSGEAHFVYRTTKRWWSPKHLKLKCDKVDRKF